VGRRVHVAKARIDFGFELALTVRFAGAPKNPAQNPCDPLLGNLIEVEACHPEHLAAPSQSLPVMMACAHRQSLFLEKTVDGEAQAFLTLATRRTCVLA